MSKEGKSDLHGEIKIPIKHITSNGLKDTLFLYGVTLALGIGGVLVTLNRAREVEQGVTSFFSSAQYILGFISLIFFFLSLGLSTIRTVQERRLSFILGQLRAENTSHITLIYSNDGLDIITGVLPTLRCPTTAIEAYKVTRTKDGNQQFSIILDEELEKMLSLDSSFLKKIVVSESEGEKLSKFLDQFVFLEECEDDYEDNQT